MGDTPITSDAHANQRCWDCGSFQRYDKSDTPEDAIGECRIDPFRGWLYNVDWFDKYSRFIPDGRIFWCSKWKMSTLDIPPAPEGSYSYIWPEVWWTWWPWAVKEEVNETCYQCNHFQHEFGGGDTYGSCRKLPYLPVTAEVIAAPNNDIIYGEGPNYWGDEWWCSCWERVQVPNPETPPK